MAEGRCGRAGELGEADRVERSQDFADLTVDGQELRLVEFVGSFSSFQWRRSE
jgi:hypothetical protein